MVLSQGLSGANVLVVPDQFSSIQAAINAAASGDTVLVRSGTYEEVLTWSNKDIILYGESGVESTILSGATTSRVIGLGPGVTRQTVLANLTIRDGFAADGAGVQLTSAAPTIRNCDFEANVVRRASGSPSRGGALFVGTGSSPLLLDCFFRENYSLGTFPDIAWPGDGGAIYVEPGASLESRRCRFEENVALGFEGGRGGAVHIHQEASALLDSCLFIDNRGYGGGIWSMFQVTVRNSVFQGNRGWSGPAIYSSYGTYLIEHNVFIDNLVDGNEGGVISAAGQGTIMNNTIAFNSGQNAYVVIDASGAQISRNVVCNNGIWGLGCSAPAGAVICNDVWGNEPANYHSGCDQTGVNGNISVDPLFCDPVGRDLTLDAASPCYSASCGTMGALGVGCGVTGVPADPDPAESPKADIRLTIRPNPVRSHTEFSITGAAKPTAFEIFDATGRVVDIIQPGRMPYAWEPSSSVRPGVYFVRLRANEGSASSKFVVLPR